MRSEDLGTIVRIKGDDQQDARLLSGANLALAKSAGTSSRSPSRISEYWSDRRKTQYDVIIAFYAELKKVNMRRHELGEVPLVPPAKETLRIWINAGNNSSNLRSKFGGAASHARFKARDW
jgi:hypothetical protein